MLKYSILYSKWVTIQEGFFQKQDLVTRNDDMHLYVPLSHGPKSPLPVDSFRHCRNDDVPLNVHSTPNTQGGNHKSGRLLPCIG